MNTSQLGESGVVRRFGSGALVILLHLLVLLALLNMVAMPQRPPNVNSREIFLRMIEPARPQASPTTTPTLPMLTRPSRGEAQSIAPPLTAPTAPLDLRGLSQSLFGCAPEALAGMTLEERSHCPGALTRPDDTVVMMPKSHVKDSERRAAELRAKNTPGSIPCSYIAVEKTSGSAVPAANLVCLADGLLGSGFAPLSGMGK